MSDAEAASRRDRNVRRPLLAALPVVASCYAIATGVVFLGVFVGFHYLELCTYHPSSQSRVDLVSGYMAWDGQWYRGIAQRGYEYGELGAATAFFPAYPLAARILRYGGLNENASLLIVSKAALLGCFLLLHANVKLATDGGNSSRNAFWTVMAFGLFPASLFFHMAYTESLFLLIVLTVMLGLRRQWPPAAIALLIGLSTATRSVGVGLLPAFAWHLWETSPTTPRFVRRSLVCLPLATWGLIGYMVFLYARFGDPLMFVKAQHAWVVRPTTCLENFLGIVTLQPAWEVYIPQGPTYWGRVPPGNALLSMYFWNPIVFVAAVSLVVHGWRQHWLTASDLLLSAGLLFIPYASQGMRMGMTSHARYASVVFPVYVVMGRMLVRMPPVMRVVTCVLSAIMLAAFAALFATWHYII